MARIVNYKQYFELVEHGARDIYTVPFEFKYYVDQAPEKLYIASFNGATYTNCQYNRDSNTLTVFFDNQELGIGQLVAEKTFHLPFVDQDGNGTISRKDTYDIILIEGEEVDPGAPSGQGLVNKELRDAIKQVDDKTKVLKSTDEMQNKQIAKNASDIQDLEKEAKNNGKPLDDESFLNVRETSLDDTNFSTTFEI